MQVTRKHNEDVPPDQRWTLDEVVLRTEVKRHEITQDKDARLLPPTPTEGVYIHGLYLEGARWNTAECCLQDQQPKVGSLSSSSSSSSSCLSSVSR